MHERNDGTGRLKHIDSGKEYDVEYQFDILNITIRRPGFPPAPGHSSSTGEVRSVTGGLIPEGIYILAT